MSIFSWFFECNKIQWLRIKKEIANGSSIAIYNFLCFALVVYIQPKRTRTSGARNVIREFPITVCIGKKSFENDKCKFSGLAIFQPHQQCVLLFLIFIVCLVAQQGFIESILIALLVSIVHLLAITINEVHSLSQLFIMIKSFF